MMFQNLKIGQRLIFGFGAILCSTLAVAVVAQVQVSSIEKSLATINDTNSVKQRYAINFRGSVHDRAINLRDVTLVTTPADLDTVTATIERLTNAYAKSAKPLDDIMAGGAGVTPDERNILASIKETEIKTMPLIAEVVRLQKSGSPDVAKTMLMQQARPAFVEWLARINQLIDLEEAKNKLVGAQARGVADGFIWLIVGVCGAAMAFGVLVSWWALGAIKPLKRLTASMKELASGNFSVAVPSLDRRDEVGEMAATVQVFKQNGMERGRLEAEAAEFQKDLDRKLRMAEQAFEAAGKDQQQVVDRMAAGLAGLAEGTLSTRIDGTFSDSYRALKDDFNAAVSSLEKTIGGVTAAVSAISGGSKEIVQASDDLARRTEQQAASLEETAAALDEITATVKKTSDGSTHARSVVATAKADAEHSGEVVRKAVLAMSAIENSAQQVSQIIGVIDEIAFQTNLLALNAGVEAARAGDAGRGFAVVASEVRALAQRSAEAAKEIKGLISKSSQQVSVGVDLVNETGSALGRIVQHVTEINAVVSDIAVSTQEQATALHQVNSAINQMDQVTQQNAAMVEESTAASHALLQETEGLAQLVSAFRVEGGTGVGPKHRARSDIRPTRAPALKTVGRGGAALKADAPAEAGWQDF